MPRLLRGLALALPVLAMLACRTSDRLWRISPFERAGSGERVNLWPLAYHDRDQTSVLWPLFDVDQRGFALRPLIAKEDSGYSVLWPLASFDTGEGEGWFFPFYSLGDNAGLFPLANFGLLSYVGLYWWTERSSGLFPLALFGRSFSYVGPVWWLKDGDEASGGLFPLAMFGRTSYVGPVWWGQDGGSFGLFPLFGLDLFGTGIDHIGPFWKRSPIEGRGEGGAERGLFPLFSYGDGWRSFSLLPLYSQDLGSRVRTRNVLLGLGHTLRSEARNESWLLPLYYHRDDAGQSDSVLVPFYWKHARGDEARVYTLLGSRSVDPASSSLNVYPLWWSNESGESSWKMLFPLFYFGRDGDERTLLTPLGGRGWSASGDDAFVNVFGPIYHHSESTRRDESRTAFLWPLFERHRLGEEHTTRMAGLYTARTTPEDSEASYAFGLGHAHHAAQGSSYRLWPLYSWSDEPKDPGVVYSLTLYGAREHGERGERWLFPFYASERGALSSSWSALLGLVHHEREGGEELRSERSWAWPLASRSRGAGPPGFVDATTLAGSTRWEGGSSFQLGASLLHSSRSTQDDEREREHARTLLFFTHDEERFLGPHVPASMEPARQNRIRSESRGFLFDAFVSERETYHVWREGALSDSEARILRAYSLPQSGEGLSDRAAATAVLAAHGVAPLEDDPAVVRQAIDGFAEANTRTFERRHVRIPLLYGYERTPDELEWTAPLGLAHYERDPESARFSLLYYGYRSSTENGRTRRDIFPFVTWDSGPEETRVSFLWHFLDYERRGERRGGHVLFVPWGDV